MNHFDGPVLNSPNHLPTRHGEFDTSESPTDKIVDARRNSEPLTALPAPSATSARKEASIVFSDALPTATTDISLPRILNYLRQEFAPWCQQANQAQWTVTPVMRWLQQHWRAIQADEAETIRPFFCQLEPADL